MTEKNNSTLFFVIVIVAIIGFFYLAINWQNQNMQTVVQEQKTNTQPTLQQAPIPKYTSPVPPTPNTLNAQDALALIEIQKQLQEIQELDNKISDCKIDLNIAQTKRDYIDIEETATECKKLILQKLNLFHKINTDNLPTSIKPVIEVRQTLTNAQDSEMNVLIYGAQLLQNQNMQNAKEKLTQVLKEQDQIFTELQNAKTSHPVEYGQIINPNYEQDLIERNRGIKLNYDKYITDKQGTRAKYILTIDPNQPLVTNLADNANIASLAPEEKTAILLALTRQQINYKSDPNWMTDWVQSPTLTLFKKEGDCDDMAVLLASLLMRAGIQNVEFCFAASTPPYQSYDHAVVGVIQDGKRYIYDATCKNCLGSATDDVTKWKTDCYDINQYYQKYNN